MVNKSAGEVVGASQAGKENIEALETIDFTKMSYTQAKKVEMDTQVIISHKFAFYSLINCMSRKMKLWRHRFKT